MKANAEPCLLSSLVRIDFGVVVSQHRGEGGKNDYTQIERVLLKTLRFQQTSSNQDGQHLGKTRAIID